MRITGFDIGEGRIGGLKALKAPKLGDVVVLAGRNGSGKSRLLRFLSLWLNHVFPFDGFAHRLDGSPTGIGLPCELWGEGGQQHDSGHSGNWWCFDDKLWEAYQRKFTPESSAYLEQVRRVLTEVSFDGNQKPSFVYFVPKETNLADPSEQIRTDRLRRSSQVAEQLGLLEYAHNAPSFIQNLQDKYREATHPLAHITATEKLSIETAYLSLQKLIKMFLNEELSRSLKGEVLLFGQPIGNNSLSEGQSILLQFCVAIHAQADRLSELIIMMDEPENHLHPAAMLDAINVIKKHLTNGQLWIATHSLPLLANFDPDCIQWMDKNTISHAGSIPETVLHGLLGDTERIERMENFLGLPAAMAINNFSAQCLLPPSVVMTGSEDTQLMQIRKVLSALKQADRPLRVLDVGAGRGRLISSLAATLPDASQTLDYLAFDPSATYQQECEDAIARCYAGETKRRWYGSMNDLKVDYSGKAMDVVVMCNVLHEIDPSEWLNGLFGTHGTVGHFLKENGYLLIVEDTEMRIGEKAHDKGFLVLNAGNLRTLFAITEDDQGFKSEAQQNGRLLATLVPAVCVGRANENTLFATLNEVKDEAFQSIKDLRQNQESTSYRQGRKLAFHLQQFANAALTIEPMGG